MLVSPFCLQGADNYGTGSYAACSTLPRHHGGAGGAGGGGGGVVVGSNGSSHPQHMLVDSVTSSAHPHSQCSSMEWPPYQGPSAGTAAASAVATLGRRQTNNTLPTNIPPPAQMPPNAALASSIVGVGPRGGLTGFRGGPSAPGVAPGAATMTSTSSQSLMGYEIPPPFQIPVLEEEAELLPDMTALNDKIESTV